MLKLILSVLSTVYGLPLKRKQFNKLAQQVEVYLAKVKQVIVNYGAEIFGDLFLLTKFLAVLRPRKRLLLIRSVMFFALAFGYFFLGPSTFVVANFPEKVIPEQTSKALITIKESIVIEAAPVFTSPIKGYVSTRFSGYHQGIDVPNPTGASVKSFTDGKVVFAGWANGGFGNLVIIQHNLGYVSKYAHLSRFNVRTGQKISSGEVIGFVGSSGNSTGSHLHFEVYQNNRAINPLNYVSPTN